MLETETEMLEAEILCVVNIKVSYLLIIRAKSSFTPICKYNQVKQEALRDINNHVTQEVKFWSVLH